MSARRRRGYLYCMIEGFLDFSILLLLQLWVWECGVLCFYLTSTTLT